MIKGFVSGVEKDIVRIPMKGKNLFNKGTITTSHYANTSGTIENGSYYCSDFIPITAATYYFQNAVGSSYQNTVVVYDANKQGLRYVRLTGGAKVSGAITFQSGDAYIRINCHYQTDVDAVMINEGSTPLPYEPYGYQEGWEVRDNQDRLIWGREDELQTATGSLQLKGYGLPVKVKSLLGNTQQTGTPTPDAPIMPEFVGVRTAQLLDIPDITTSVKGVEIEIHGGTIYLSGTASSNGGRTQKIFGPFILKAGTYRFTGNSPVICFLQSVTDTTKYYNINSINPITIDEDSSWYFSINVVGGTNYDGESISNLMLNLGSTALPYEPYGWAEKITCAGQTTPVYLGEVPTVRRIKKLVLTGEETYTVGSVIGQIRTLLTGAINSLGYCTHYILKASYGGAFPYIRISGGGLWFELSPDEYETKEEALADFKAYLAQQYAAGTPVTVWYVLATPETPIVNEPLCKIGDYADELNDTVATLPEIPTTTGQNTLTVDTTLAPSNLTIKGHVKQSS